MSAMSDSIHDLEERCKLASARPATGTVAVLVVRKEGGVHETPASVEVSPPGGFHGDRWGTDDDRDPEAQITLMDSRVVEALVGEDREKFHIPGDNIVLDLDLAQDALPVGTRLRIGSAVLEITAKPHLGCAKFRARLGDDALRWVNTKENRIRRLRGVYARVIQPGVISVGDRATTA